MSFQIKLLLCLVALLLALIWLSTPSPSHATTSAKPSPVPQLSGQGEHSILGPPSLPANVIDRILCQAGSPACHTGQDLSTYGKEYGIDPAYALAFFWHESNFGKYGIAHDNLGIGNIRCTQGYTCLNGFRAYQSWQEGYEDWYRLITWYIHTLHKSTIETIVPTYAPPGDHNDTPAYIASVVSSVLSWRREVKA